MLFVAEKRAALDAVIKRLSHPERGPRSSGARSARRVRVAEGGNDAACARIGADTDTRCRLTVPSSPPDYEVRRRQLNDHARVREHRSPPRALSVNQMVGRLLRLPADGKVTTLRLVAHWLHSRPSGTRSQTMDPRGCCRCEPTPGKDPIAVEQPGHQRRKPRPGGLDLATKVAVPDLARIRATSQHVVNELGCPTAGTMTEVAHSWPCSAMHEGSANSARRSSRQTR